MMFVGDWMRISGFELKWDTSKSLLIKKNNFQWAIIGYLFIRKNAADQLIRNSKKSKEVYEQKTWCFARTLKHQRYDTHKINSRHIYWLYLPTIAWCSTENVSQIRSIYDTRILKDPVWMLACYFVRRNKNKDKVYRYRFSWPRFRWKSPKCRLMALPRNVTKTSWKSKLPNISCSFKDKEPTPPTQLNCLKKPCHLPVLKGHCWKFIPSLASKASTTPAFSWCSSEQVP